MVAKSATMNYARLRELEQLTLTLAVREWQVK